MSEQAARCIVTEWFLALPSTDTNAVKQALGKMQNHQLVAAATLWHAFRTETPNSLKRGDNETTDRLGRLLVEGFSHA